MWINIGKTHKYRPFDFYVYTVPIAHLKEIGGKCSAEKERKASEIIESVERMLRREVNELRSNSVADEVVSRLDKEGINWVHIDVSTEFDPYFSATPSSDDISRVSYYSDYCGLYSIRISICLTA